MYDIYTYAANPGFILRYLVFGNTSGNEIPKEVLKSLVTGYEAKLKYADYFMGVGFQTNFYARAHILLKMDQSLVNRLLQNGKTSVLYSGMISDEQTVRLIDEFSLHLTKWLL